MAEQAATLRCFGSHSTQEHRRAQRRGSAKPAPPATAPHSGQRNNEQSTDPSDTAARFQRVAYSFTRLC